MEKILPDVLSDPYERYQSMRDTCPLYRNKQMDIWEVFRYQDVLHVLNTPDEFSSQITPDSSTLLPCDRSLIFSDGSRHRQLRSLVQPHFTPNALEAWGPRIRVIAQDLLHQVSRRGHMEVVEDLAALLPTRVIAELLGVPYHDYADFARWSCAASQSDQWKKREDFWLEEMYEAHEYFQRMIVKRRASPQDDLISWLVTAHIDGVALLDEEVQGFCVLLLTAGIETTRELLSNVFLCLVSFPGLEDLLRANPSWLNVAIEEILRYRAPVQFQVRVAQRDVHIGDALIRSGQTVVPYLGSANRDERIFPHPDQLDILRSPNRHLAFGLGGAHFCLGAPLARLEARIALRMVLERIGEIHRIGETPLEATGAALGGVRRLEICFHERNHV
jgi:cytochrome P450